MIRITLVGALYADQQEHADAFADAIRYELTLGSDKHSPRMLKLLDELHTMDSITITDKCVADELITLLKSLPGWADGYKPVKVRLIDDTARYGRRR